MDQISDDTCVGRTDLIAPHAPVLSFIAHEIAAHVLPGMDEQDRTGVAMFCLVIAASCMDVFRDPESWSEGEQRAWSAMVDELCYRGYLPTAAQQRCRQLGIDVISLENSLGRTLAADELAGVLGISTAQYYALQREMNALLILDGTNAVQDGDGASRGAEDLSGADEDGQPALSRAGLVDSLARTIDSLPEPEMIVVNLFYNEELSLEEIGDLMGLEEAQVSKLHSQAIVRLRSQFRQYN